MTHIKRINEMVNKNSQKWEDCYNKCYNIISQANSNGLISPDDDIDDNMYELLEFVNDFDDLSVADQEMYEEAMCEAWSNYDEWQNNL